MTKTPRQPVQIPVALLKRLRQFGKDRGGLPLTRIVILACEAYLKAQKGQ